MCGEGNVFACMCACVCVSGVCACVGQLVCTWVVQVKIYCKKHHCFRMGVRDKHTQHFINAIVSSLPC